MSQVQLLARCLEAAGYTFPNEGDGLHLLFVDPEQSALIAKFWLEDNFTDQELIASSVRPNSSASYLITSTDKLSIYITPSSTLRVVRYDEDEEDWTEDDSIKQFAVHPDGKVTGAVGGDQSTHVFFQDPSKHLVHLDGTWTATVLPADPVAGTPLATVVVDDQVHVFYISAVDKRMHCISPGPKTRWNDKACGSYAFETIPKQIFLMQQEGGMDVYALTEKKEIQRITSTKGQPEATIIFNFYRPVFVVGGWRWWY
jgi:hypothetical protein